MYPDLIFELTHKNHADQSDHPSERSLTVHNIVNRATTEVENRILDTLKKNTGSLRAEIGKLTSSLNEMPINCRENQMGELSLEHQIQLAHLSEQVTQIWEYQRASDEASKSLEALRNIETAQHRILQSLQFPQMQERKEEISIAYENTYEWLFEADQHRQDGWHDFVAWARADNPSTIYWIHGKPGESPPRQRMPPEETQYLIQVKVPASQR